MPANPTLTLTSSKIKPFCNPERARKIAVKLPAGVNYKAGQTLEETSTAAQDEVQTITLGGTPSGGTFTLLYPSGTGGYDSVGPITWSATGATLQANIQAALDAYFGTGQVVVTGTGPFTLTYSGSEVTKRDIAQPIAVNNLTGTTPTVTPATSTPGSSGAVGVYQIYGSGNARAVLEANTRTDAKGQVLDQFGAPSGQSAEAFIGGIFLESDIIGLDTTAVPDNGTAGTLGKRKAGASLGATGGLIEIL